jgi:uncharacterized membrane protein
MSRQRSSKSLASVAGELAVIVLLGLLLGGATMVALLFLFFILFVGRNVSYWDLVWNNPGPFWYVSAAVGVLVFLAIVGVGVWTITESPRGSGARVRKS